MTGSHRFALALVAALAAALAGCSTDQARIQEHLERAEAYREDAAFAEAVLEYRNILQIDPNHAQAHFGLARTYLATHKLSDAAWQFRETVRLAPDNLEARLWLGEFLGGADELEEALAQADAVLAAETGEEESSLLVSAHLLRARVLDMQNKPLEALEGYEKAVALAPEAPKPTLLLANFYRRRGEADKAEPLFRKLVEKNPGYVSYAALGGFLSRDRAREAEAEEAYRLALETAEEGERVLAYRLLANFYYGRGRVDEAEATLKRALEERPDELELIYLLARFYLGRGQKPKADEMVEMATQAHPDEVGPYLILSRYRFYTGETEACLEALDRALQVDPDNDEVRLERAERLVDVGVKKGPRERIREARGVVQQVLAKGAATSAALGLKGKLDLLERRGEEAVRSLRQAVELRPDWAPLHFLLGWALYVEGSFMAAGEELERALELDRSMLEARIILTRNYAALGKHDLVIDEGRGVLRQRPGDHDLRRLVAQSLAIRGELDAALAQLNRIPGAERDTRTLVTYGRLFAAKRDLATARSFYEQALATSPQSPGILNLLLTLDEREGRLEESIRRIDAALESEPDNDALVHLRGIVAMVNGRSEEAEARFRRAIELNPGNPVSYASLARLLQASGRGDEALWTYEKAVAERPDLASLHLIVATLYELRGGTERAIWHYEEAIGLDDRLVAAKNDLANLLAEKRRDLDRALRLAQEARSAMPESPQVADTMGWVLYRMGMASAAIGYLEEAVALSADDPDVGVIRYHLASAYAANLQPREARKTIRRALAELDSGTGQPKPKWAKDMRRLEKSLGRKLAVPWSKKPRGRPQR